MKTVSRFLIAVVGLIVSMLTDAQVPLHNSYPSAAATIFLDFDGHLVEGTSWNYAGPVVCGPSNMTNEQVTEIFHRVAEDYRPFNVNVTTDSTKYWAAPQFQRMRVIITISSSWYGLAGGVSYLNSFKWGDNTPCFVFSALLGYNTKKVAEASSHEAGHTLGLNHQSSYDGTCKQTAEYNPGTGSGEISWAPIMGNSYSRNVTLWHNGTNPWGCSSFQDDLSIITSNVSYRADDYSGNTNGSTSQLNFSNNQFFVEGVIERSADKDAFKFVMPTQGKLSLNANPFNVGSGRSGSNLDIKVELLSNSQNVIGSYNPDLSLNAVIDTLLNAGTYYLRVQSMGNAYAPEYATLGSYSLAADFIPSSVLPLHELRLHGTTENNVHKFNWTVEADENIIHQVLEASNDGIHFQQLNAFSSITRSYSYVPYSNGTLYYRMRVRFDDDKEYLSNTIAIKINNDFRPSIAGNIAPNSLKVSSPSSFNYNIADLNGRTVLKGNLLKGSNAVSIAGLQPGTYIIQYYGSGRQYAEKFMKQ